LSPEETQRILGGTITPEESFAYWIAAVRELFEEAGVLLAYTREGSLFKLRNQDNRDKFFRYRHLLQKGEMTLCEMIGEEKLLLALDQLHYYAYWITPKARSERFDTRFFFARCPMGQEASHDQKETTVGNWITPRKALEENRESRIILPPPTLKTLEDLSGFRDIEAVFKSLTKEEIQPIIPILMNISGESFILFPWDSEYEMFQRGETPALLDHGRPSQPGDNSTRLILKEDHWIPYYHH